MQKTSTESGNVFFLILLGIAIFGALTYAFMPSLRVGQDGLTKERADLAAVEIVDYAETIKNAVARMIASGKCTENQISFENEVYQDFNGALAQPLGSQPLAIDRCKIFHPKGGGLSAILPAKASFPEISAGDLPPGQSTKAGHPIMIIAQVVNLAGGPDVLELMIKVPHVPDEVCKAINKKWGILGDSNDNLPINNDWGMEKFDGDYTPLFPGAGTLGNVDNTLRNQSAFCARYTTGSKIDAAYYHVLLAR